MVCKFQSGAPIGTLDRRLSGEPDPPQSTIGGRPRQWRQRSTASCLWRRSPTSMRDVGCAASRSAFALVSADVPCVVRSTPDEWVPRTAHGEADCRHPFNVAMRVQSGTRASGRRWAVAASSSLTTLEHHSDTNPVQLANPGRAAAARPEGPWLPHAGVAALRAQPRCDARACPAAKAP